MPPSRYLPLVGSLHERRAAALDRVALAVYGPNREIPPDAELRALLCASHGLTRMMIADVLGVSPDTVKTQLQRARQRLAAKNTTHAVALAIRAGLIL